MPETQFSLPGLLTRIKDSHPREMVAEAAKARQAALSYMRGKRKPLYDSAAVHYAQTGRFLFFLQTGGQPSGITQREIALYRDFFAHQVERGLFNGSIIGALAEWTSDAPDDW